MEVNGREVFYLKLFGLRLTAWSFLKYGLQNCLFYTNPDESLPQKLFRGHHRALALHLLSPLLCYKK